MNKQKIVDALLAVARDLGAGRISLQDAQLRLDLIDLLDELSSQTKRLVTIQDSIDYMQLEISRIESKIGKTG